jgi:hypothetical protein
MNTMKNRLPVRISGQFISALTALGLAISPSFAHVVGGQSVLTLSANSHDNEAFVLPVQSFPYGLSYGEWSARWWQWAFSLPVDHSPLFGADCSAGQTDHVWFLPGAEVGGPTPRQDCTIPPGTALFVAIINAECSNLEGLGKTEAQLRSCADSDGSLIDPNSLSASLDGQPLTNLSRYLVESPLFFFGPLPKDNLITYFCVAQAEGCPAAPAGSIGYSVGTGVYLMFSPLSVGTHLLHFHAEFAVSPPVVFDTTYHLTVQP